MSCGGHDTIPRLNLSDFIDNNDILELTSFKKKPLSISNQSGSQPFFLHSTNNSSTPQIFKGPLNKETYKAFNTQLVLSLYRHLFFLANIVPIELSIEKYCNNSDLKDKSRKIYIHQDDATSLNKYQYSINTAFFVDFFLKTIPINTIHSLTKSSFDLDLDKDSTNYYIDFILKWCSLMSSDKGSKLINLFEKNKFKPEYIQNLKFFTEAIKMPIISTIMSDAEKLTGMTIFTARLQSFINLFIFPISESQKYKENIE
jgi:hypothetical protein